MSFLSVVSFEDFALVASLLYFCADLYQQWDIFSMCCQPIHKWLFASCVGAITFRIVRLLNTWTAKRNDDSTPSSAQTTLAGESSFFSGGTIEQALLDLSPKGAMSRLLAALTWVAVPFFTVWTLLGTFWMYEVMRKSPGCLGPTSTYAWILGLWLCLCYYWIIVHLALAMWAFKLNRQARWTASNMRGVVDEEVLRRWGPISGSISNRTLADVASSASCLSCEEIKALPCEVLGETVGKCECSICITELEPGESVRRLRCGHTFHRSCIDLWLVRRADCPLCKQDVRAKDGADSDSKKDQ